MRQSPKEGSGGGGIPQEERKAWAGGQHCPNFQDAAWGWRGLKLLNQGKLSLCKERIMKPLC